MSAETPEFRHPEKIDENARVPNLEEQLRVVVQLGKETWENAPSEKRQEAWTAYIKCIDDYRTAGGLKPFNSLGDSFVSIPATNMMEVPAQSAIEEALKNGRADILMEIFANEQKQAKEQQAWASLNAWEKAKRIPGVNFAAGVAGGAGEIAHGVALIANEGRKALGFTSSWQEREAAKKTLSLVAKSLGNLGHLAAAIGRKSEYEASFQEMGDTTGYVMGKHYFDVATALLGGAAVKAAIGGTSKAGVETAVRTAAEAAIVENMASAMGAAAIADTAQGVAEKGIMAALKRLPKAAGYEAKKIVEHGTKESAKEAAKGMTQAGE